VCVTISLRTTAVTIRYVRIVPGILLSLNGRYHNKGIIYVNAMIVIRMYIPVKSSAKPKTIHQESYTHAFDSM